MDRALKRLERVLELEKQQGYQNKAVVGGIRQFAVFWVSQANEEAADEGDLAQCGAGNDSASRTARCR